jgi:hypothetical protein
MEIVQQFLKEAETMDFILLGIAFMFIIRAIVSSYRIFTGRRKIRQELRETLKKLKENKCKGPHNWVNAPVQSGETHVCKDCYYTPKYDSFVDKTMFETEMKMRKMDEELKVFKEQRLEEIAEKFGIPEPAIMTEMAEEIIGIKKEFTLKQMDELIAELLKKDE